jgi:N-acetylglutamate synthase-like GNAT family acetyltransferase
VYYEKFVVVTMMILVNVQNIINSQQLEKYAEQAAKIMNRHWTQISEEFRKRKILEHARNQGFPTSLLLIDDDTDNVIGHASIASAQESAEGKACVVYSVIVDQTLRGKGIGKLLMGKIEQVAVDMEFAIMYLFTNDQEQFYRKCGFIKAPKVSALGANAHRLNSEQLKGLEALFAQRSAKVAPEWNADHDSIWMRKIIIESFSKFVDSYESLWAEAKTISIKKECNVIAIPWQKQIGPSCGILLVRLLRELFTSGYRKSQIVFDSATGELKEQSESIHPPLGISNKIFTGSLLDLCKSQKFSLEGEMLNYANLQSIIHQVLPFLSVQSFPISSKSTLEIINILKSGSIILAAYDKDKDNRPTTRPIGESQHAHWIAIVGHIDSSILLGIHGMSSSAVSFEWTQFQQSTASLSPKYLPEGREWTANEIETMDLSYGLEIQIQIPVCSILS